MGEIRIVKEKKNNKTSDYTFQDDGLNIGNSELSSEKKEQDTKKKAAQIGVSCHLRTSLLQQ